MGSVASWDNARRTLKETFRQNEAQIEWFSQIRNELGALASRGITSAPDFTLHNETHSDNLVLLLGKLKTHFTFELSEYETKLLLTSAYMHDIGMFFSKALFIKEILPHLADALKFCKENMCENPSKYESELPGRPVGFQIRAVHHLLSAYMLREDGKELFRLDADDKPHVIAICRGHRKANLCNAGCNCYEPKEVINGEVRRDLLAALLRLADALDFYSDRAPVGAFIAGAPDFLEDPIALKHWIKHYFATAVAINPSNPQGSVYLACHLSFTVPDSKNLNGVSYQNFLLPLFEEFISDAKGSDFDINQYPPLLHQIFKIRDIRLTHQVEAEPGARELPSKIIQSIEHSGCRDALQFIKFLETSQNEHKPKPLSIMDRKPEVRTFTCLLDGDDTQHSLLVMVGESGQGKTLLMKTFEQLSVEHDQLCLKLDLSGGLVFERILDGIWQLIGQHNFPQYSAFRERTVELTSLSRLQRQSEMTNRFFDDWRAISQPSRLVILLDTYEEATSILQDWIENSFLEDIQAISQSIVVIGGRQWPKTGEYWINHSYRFPLKGVQLHDYRDYGQQCDVTISEVELTQLHQKWQGQPKLFVEFVNLRSQGGI